MKLIFLDRDGVINKYPGDRAYVTEWAQFAFLPGSLDAIRRLTEERFTIFVVSNQGGISKGIYTQEKLDEITANMLREIEQNRGAIKKVLYCIHREADKCSCRKPKTGLIHAALELLNMKMSDMNTAYFIGDTISDVQTGKAAGCKTFLVFSGREKKHNESRWETKPDYQAADLQEAVNVILHEDSYRLRDRRGGP